MKKLINFLSFCIVFVVFGCSKTNFPTVIELKKNENEKLEIVDHETGKFLVTINPISYIKSKKHMTIKGVIAYPGKDHYSKKFDTLIAGVDNVTISLGKISPDKKVLLIKKKIIITDCNGIFEISFKRSLKTYIIFEGIDINTTGLNTENYFKNFQNSYNSILIIKNPGCK